MIDSLSLTSVLIEPFYGNIPLALASGIIINMFNSYFLVTNWHVVTGKNPITDKLLDERYGSIPNKLKIWVQPKFPKNYQGISLDIPLYSKEIDSPEHMNKLWCEHPQGRKIDVVLLPLDCPALDIYTFNLSLAKTPLQLPPSIPVSIIGFPFGKTSFEKLPFWVTGFMASEWTIEESKVFINAPARSGLSGAPVICRQFGNLPDAKGNTLMNGNYRDMLVGIYSGRIDEKADIGTVWKPTVINQILEFHK